MNLFHATTMPIDDVNPDDIVLTKSDLSVVQTLLTTFKSVKFSTEDRVAFSRMSQYQAQLAAAKKNPELPVPTADQHFEIYRWYVPVLDGEVIEARGIDEDYTQKGMELHCYSYYHGGPSTPPKITDAHGEESSYFFEHTDENQLNDIVRGGVVIEQLEGTKHHNLQALVTTIYDANDESVVQDKYLDPWVQMILSGTIGGYIARREDLDPKIGDDKTFQLTPPETH